MLNSDIWNCQPNLKMDTNSTQGYISGTEMMSTESNVVLIIIYTMTTMLAVCGNAVVIVVFLVGKRWRSDLRGYLINLACSDLIMSIFCMPFTFTSTMLKNWIFSPPMCPIVLYLQTVSVSASVFTNMAIGIDRFWVVVFPLKSRFKLNMSGRHVVKSSSTWSSATHVNVDAYQGSSSWTCQIVAWQGSSCTWVAQKETHLQLEGLFWEE